MGLAFVIHHPSSTVQIPRRVNHNQLSTQCHVLAELFHPSHAATRVPGQTLETGSTSVVAATIPVEQEEADPTTGPHPATFLLRPTSRKVLTRPESSRRSPRLPVRPHPSTSRSRTRAMSRRTIGSLRKSLRSSFQERVFPPPLDIAHTQTKRTSS